MGRKGSREAREKTSRIYQKNRSFNRKRKASLEKINGPHYSETEAAKKGVFVPSKEPIVKGGVRTPEITN